MFQNWFNRRYSLALAAALKHKKLCLSLFFLVLLISGYGLTKLKITYSTYDLIEPSFKSYQITQELRQSYNDKNILILHLNNSKSAPKKNDLCSLKKWFDDTVLIRPDVQVIWNPFSLRQAVVQDQDSFKKIWFPKVTPLNCDTNESDKNYFETVNSLDVPNKNFFFGTNLDSLMYVLKVNSDPIQFYKTISSSYDNFKTTESTDWDSYWMGEAVYENFVIEGNNSTGLVNSVAILIIFLIFLLYFRNMKVFGLFLIVLLSALIVVHGVMGWLGHKLDLLSLGIFLMLMIAIVEDFYFVIIEMYESNTAFERLAFPSLLTSVTTFVGFITLCFSDLFILRKFGAYVAFGALLEWFMLFFILPLTIAVFPKLKVTQHHISPLPNRVFQKMKSYFISKRISLGIIFIIPLGFLFLNKMNINASPASLYSQDHPINVSRNVFLNNVKYDFETSLVFNKNVTITKKEEVLAYLKNYDSVSRIESYKDYLNFMLKTVSPEDRSGLALEIQESDFSGRYISKSGNERHILHLTRSDFNFVNRLNADVEKQCAGQCHVGGVLMSFAELGSQILKSLAESVYLSASIVFLILFLYAVSLNFSYLQALVISMCGLFGPAMTLFCLWLFDQEMNLATSICFAGLIGIAGDNVIQLISKTKSLNTIEFIEEKFTTSLLITFTMAVLCLSFGLSDFKALQQLGYWMAFGFLFGFIGDYYLLKSYLQKSSIN